MIKKRLKLLKESFKKFEIEDSTKSPGWIRYQKRIK